MILWNRGREYNRKLTSKDRAKIANDIATSGTQQFVCWLNILVNITVLGVVILIFDFNLAAFAIAFVMTDMVLTVLDHLIFIVIPRWRTEHSSLSASQRRIKVVQEKHDALKARIDDFKNRECSRCDRNYGSCYCTSCYKTEYYDLHTMSQFLFEEKDWVASKLAVIKEEEIKTDERHSKDYSNKTEYFSSIVDKLNYFKNNYEITALTQVLQAINELNNTLEKKPMGYSLIPGTLYAYLDELQNILNKWIELDEKQKSAYEQDIVKIANALGKNINRLNERINRLETEDIEVGIAVLLSELTEEEKKEENKNV